ncbi:putative terpene cyclase [Exidia glandulosa HHB12029]|uniref:Terpene synthase n=1 Tax=Exidia glandulosa HHB12029 TaxID=1314781 RepID=A0A165MUR8_EXIGL|nr:putative terpene cyclase [Exidia glandulosa HHB12029]
MATSASDSPDVEQPVYCLPDNLRNWPWLRCINPFYEEAKKASTAWIRGFRAFSPKAQKAFESCDFDRLAALAYPSASYDELRVTCDYMNFTFAFDEQSDRARADEVRIMVDAMVESLRGADGSKVHLFGEICTQFWSRVVPLASHGVQRRFVKHFQKYVNSVVEEARDREAKRMRTVEEYFTLRRLTAGAHAILILLQLGMCVRNDNAFEDPTVLRLETLTIDMIILGNDLYSYNVEQARGDSHNILAVVQNQYNWPLDRALLWLAEQHDARVEEFLAQKDSAPPEVAKYVDGLGNWVRANDAWSFESPRYFGTHGLDVMRERKVVLLSKRKTDDVDEA